MTRWSPGTRVSLVLFDLDGTLIDAAGEIAPKGSPGMTPGAGAGGGGAMRTLGLLGGMSWE